MHETGKRSEVTCQGSASCKTREGQGRDIQTEIKNPKEDEGFKKCRQGAGKENRGKKMVFNVFFNGANIRLAGR